VFSIFKPKTNQAKKELANIIICKDVYDKDSINGIDGSLPLYYLSIHNDEREFASRICLCKSELEALKTIYNVKYSYSTQKVYTLELKQKNITLLEEIQTTLKDVWEDEKLKQNFKYRLSEGITTYTKKDLKKIDEKCELIWDMDSREPMCVVKRGEKFILPQDVMEKKAYMPFGLSGGNMGMIDKNGKYGIINTGNSLKNDLNYKLLYPFEYHYIRLDGFGNAELLRDPIDHGGDYKKLICTMVSLWDSAQQPKQVLLNSTTKDEYITVDNDGLLIQHTKNGSSKPYKTIIQNFLKIKPVQDSTGLWGYIDKDAKEIIPCKFRDWNFFNNGYAVLKEDDKPFVIDEMDNVVVEPKYEFIQHYEKDLFFVKKNSSWAVFKGCEVFVDFIDIDAKLKCIQKEQGLKSDEVIEFLRKDFFMDTMVLMGQDEPHYLILKIELLKRKKALHSKMYKLPLKEYMALFDIPQNQKDLQEMGLWGKEVEVKECEIVKNYQEILNDSTTGTIGFSHQVGASCYAMDIELPVIFTKKDSTTISLGIRFDSLSIKKVG
jgi:hypothetical protein